MLNRLKRILLSSAYDVVVSNQQLGRWPSGSYCYGMIQPDTQTIRVRKTLGLEERTKTLVHELIHAAMPRWEEEIVEEITLKLYERMDEQDLGFFMYFVMGEDLAVSVN